MICEADSVATVKGSVTPVQYGYVAREFLVTHVQVSFGFHLKSTEVLDLQHLNAPLDVGSQIWRCRSVHFNLRIARFEELYRIGRNTSRRCPASHMSDRVRHLGCQILTGGGCQKGEQGMQNPAHGAMVGRSGWFDNSQEIRVILPRRSFAESLAMPLTPQQFPTGSVRAPLREFFELQRRQLEVPRLPDPAWKKRSHTKRSLCFRSP